MLHFPSMECNQFNHFPPCVCNILFFGVISNILSFVICKRQTPTENLCIVNEDHPRCNVPRKAINACPGTGWGPLSHLESGHAVPFSPQDFCCPCEFVIAATTHRPHWPESASSQDQSSSWLVYVSIEPCFQKCFRPQGGSVYQ